MPSKTPQPTVVRMHEVTADGDVIIGRVRPKNNPLIHRSEVGKPLFHNDLPPLPGDYTFGAPLKRDAEGAGDVMLTWQTHDPPPSKMTYDFGRDFVSLNRNCVHERCVTSKDVAEYRRLHDARIKPKVTGTRPLIAPPALIRDPHHAFGATRKADAESMADLIQNRFEFEWVAEQKQRMEEIERQRTEALRAASSRPLASLRRARERQQQRAEQATSAANRCGEAPYPGTGAVDIAHRRYVMKRFAEVPSRFSSTPPPVGNLSPVRGHDRSGSALPPV